MISEKKMQIVINNYFRRECNTDTSIREAFEKGFRLGVQKMQKRGTWEIYVISMFDGEGCRCSLCGTEGTPHYDFCPGCGADMRQGD